MNLLCCDNMLITFLKSTLKNVLLFTDLVVGDWSLKCDFQNYNNCGYIDRTVGPTRWVMVSDIQEDNFGEYAILMSIQEIQYAQMIKLTCLSIILLAAVEVQVIRCSYKFPASLE